jgi:hypothetical protein
MKTGNGNAPRESATSSHVAERSPHRGRSLKIANLPAEIRDELNYRISDGDEGIELVEWLNSKPEVADVVNKLFDGTPISEQNLSEWRKRGYQKWLAHRNFVDEPPRFPTTPETSPKLESTATSSFSPSPRRTPRRRRTGSSRPASKCSTSWPFTKTSPMA